MKLTKIKHDDFHFSSTVFRGKAYYVISCKSKNEYDMMKERMKTFGWNSCDDGLDDYELGFFVASGKYGYETHFKRDYKNAKNVK